MKEGEGGEEGDGCEERVGMGGGGGEERATTQPQPQRDPGGGEDTSTGGGRRRPPERPQPCSPIRPARSHYNMIIPYVYIKALG